jgi:hypothetical protein
LRVTYLCRRCARAGVSRDARVQWDLRTQRWMIVELGDNAYCHDCHAETTLVEREVTKQPTRPTIAR